MVDRLSPQCESHGYFHVAIYRDCNEFWAGVETQGKKRLVVSLKGIPTRATWKETLFADHGSCSG